jgi:hypothetical protein
MKSLAAITAAALSFWGAAAHAIPVDWTLDYSNQGVFSLTASGTFTYDADTGVFSDVAITANWAEFGELFFDVARETPDGLGNTFEFATTDAADLTDEFVAGFPFGIFQPNLTNAGGTISGGFLFDVVQCTTSTCGNFRGFGQLISATGTLVGVPQTGTEVVPLPASAVLLIGGLTALGGLARARRRAG